jgi:WD40 repeat protein
MLASGDQIGTLMLWDMSDTAATRGTTVRPVAMVAGISENVWSVQFSPDGKSVVTGDNAGKLRFWDVETLLKAGVPEDFDIEILSQEPMSQVQAHSNALETLVFSPDGKRLATGGADGKILLWDAATVMNAGATPLKELGSLQGVINEVVFSPDGKMIAAAGDGKSIVVWDAVSSQEIFRFHGHTTEVNCLAFSPDSRMLASGENALTDGGSDTTLRLWDVVEDQLIGGFEEHFSEVRTLAFRRDGKVLASGGNNSKTLLWDMDANSWSARVCECVDRNLTRREYARYIDSEPAAYDTKYAKEPTCSDLPVEK